jgi:hypothetical protein
MTTSKVQRLLLVGKLPLAVLALIKFVQGLIAALTNNAHLPSPNPPLVKLTASLNALVTAEAATKTRAAGTVPARDAARLQVISDVHALKAYVQQVADANPDQAAAIITSAGFTTRKATVRVKPPFAAKPGLVSGSVKLVARSAGLRASYEWQMSTDEGKTWLVIPPSLQAHTTVVGLAVTTTVLFRYRAITKAGPGDWSLTTSIVVS